MGGWVGALGMVGWLDAGMICFPLLTNPDHGKPPYNPCREGELLAEVAELQARLRQGQTPVLPAPPAPSSKTPPPLEGEAASLEQAQQDLFVAAAQQLTQECAARVQQVRVRCDDGAQQYVPDGFATFAAPELSHRLAALTHPPAVGGAQGGPAGGEAAELSSHRRAATPGDG